MTTQEIRKSVTVLDWFIYLNGINIKYRHKDAEGHIIIYDIHLSIQEAKEELIAIGAIEEGVIDFVWIRDNYSMSQWDALNLVIRHECKKSLEQDSNMLEIDTALNALKNI